MAKFYRQSFLCLAVGLFALAAHAQSADAITDTSDVLPQSVYGRPDAAGLYKFEDGFPDAIDLNKGRLAGNCFGRGTRVEPDSRAPVANTESKRVVRHFNAFDRDTDYDDADSKF